MAVTVTITLSNADAARVTAWAVAQGFPDGKTGAETLIASAVRQWELQAQINAVQTAYVPIAPT